MFSRLFFFTTFLIPATAFAADQVDEQPGANAFDHWAFQRPVGPELPATGDDAWSVNPIDVLLAAARDARGLRPVPDVEKSLLLRRVYLDLIGLPPTRRQMRSFLADESTDAYEKVVDRLLESPHYGERWGRHWMDIWRYADWFGLGAQVRYSQKHLWHWRDWIVESLNDDKGYDRMILEMLAADEITPTDRNALRATGFLARNYFLFNRTTWLDNTIEHTSKAFLGLTLNCVKCHEHKYDPIPQVDYYRMRAFFEPHQVRLDLVPGQVDPEKDGRPRVFDAHPDAPTYVHMRGSDQRPDTSRTIEPGVPDFLDFRPLEIRPVVLPLHAHSPSLQAFVVEDQNRAAAVKINAARDALEETRKSNASAASIGVAEKRLEAARIHPEALRAADAADRAKHEEPPAADLEEIIHRAAVTARRYELAVAELDQARAKINLEEADKESKAEADKKFAEAEDALKKARQAIEQPGQAYTSLLASVKAPEGPDETEESIRQPFPKTSTGRRTALARWITDRRNPLTARVAVNHIWLRHFGQPLVKPVADFGLRSKRPAHLALLDWLALELMTPVVGDGEDKGGWSMKRLHRLMVTSRTYRLSTSTIAADEATRRADPENAYYWRRKPARMESQIIRDSLLLLADGLDTRLGGPSIGVKGEATTFRRSLYFTHSRDDKHVFLSVFDDADILGCYRRHESIVPQQALALANSRLCLEMAQRIARGLEGETDEEFVKAAFQTVLCRPPAGDELLQCIRTMRDLTKSLSDAPNSQTVERARWILVHVLLNHNDFITIR